MKLRMPDKDTRGIDMTSVDYLSLRDKIAIEAMREFISKWSDKHVINVDDISHDSYAMADAMIKQRNK